MLRSGYSSVAVQAELAVRRYVGDTDAAAQKMLADAGGSPELVLAIGSGAFAVSPDKISDAQLEMATQAKRKAMQAEESRKQNMQYQSQVARERGASPTTSKMSPGSGKLLPLFHDDLVQSRNGILTRVLADSVSRKKLFALYFSAQWCGPCRKFTPELVDYYNRTAPQHPEFEIIFLSADRSPSAMEKYMKEFQMPWPAIEYGKVEGKVELRKFAGQGIPCLVLVDSDGRVLSDTYVGGKYVGPEKVLTDLDAIFGIAKVAKTP